MALSNPLIHVHLFFQFFTILLVILLAEVAAGVLGIVYKEGFEINIESGMKAAFGNYSIDETLTDEVNYMQNEVSFS
jgi:hypothetical protein